MLPVETVVPAPLELEVPPAPTLAEAEDAHHRYPCYTGHVFPTCFVCGPGRPEGDGLELYPGPVRDWSLLACPWRPRSDLLDSAGFVRPEIVWSALDCPGYFACLGERPEPAVLGELHAERLAAVPGDRTLVVFAWPLGRDGRKCYAGSAIADPGGEVLHEETWSEAREWVERTVPLGAPAERPRDLEVELGSRSGIEIGPGWQCFGVPIIQRHRESTMRVGERSGIARSPETGPESRGRGPP